MSWAVDTKEQPVEGPEEASGEVPPAVPAPSTHSAEKGAVVRKQRPLRGAPVQRELSEDIARSNARDPEAQSDLLGRLRELKSSLPREASELQASLDLAVTLTQHLISMGGLGPEDLLQIVARMVREVELGAASHAPKRRSGVVLSSQGVSTEGLRLIGPAGENGKLLGEVMIQLGYATREQIDEASRTQRAAGVRLGEALVARGVATWAQVRRAVSVQEQFRS